MNIVHLKFLKDKLNHTLVSFYHVAGTSRPKVRGNIRLQVALEMIERVATETGLPADHIITLIDIAANGNFRKTNHIIQIYIFITR